MGSRYLPVRYTTLIFGLAELPVVFRAKPGVKCLQKSDLSISRSVRRMTPLGKPEGRKRQGSFRCTDIRSWHANLKVPNPVPIVRNSPLESRARKLLMHFLGASGS